MGKLILGLVIGVALVLGAEYLFFTRGGMPVAARNARPLPMERLLTGRALEGAIGKDADRPAPFPADDENLLAGARVYHRNCEVCHGAPGAAERSAIARGMFPHPPKLMPPDKGVTDDPVGETYWKVKNGIRLTGMPSFDGALTEAELWQVSLLLRSADKLPGPVAAALR
jgi:thiosulfate dehydrogenase